jgi:mannose-6-phosphate isomerase-like protein (cupin superfamily)
VARGATLVGMKLIEDGRAPTDLLTTPLHLGLGSRARPVDGFAWDPQVLDEYSAAVAGDGAEGRMVMIFDGDGRGDHWECHPSGDEVVACISGKVTVVRETDEVVLGPGEATVNPAGAWHVVDMDGPARVLTITAGVGTEHRAR